MNAIAFARPVVVLFVLSLAAPSPAGSNVGGSLAAWQRHRDAVRRDPALLRYYTFDGPLSPKSPVPSLVGPQGALAYQQAAQRGVPAERFEVVQGRWPGKQALRLDQNVLSASPFALKGKGFAVAAWLRIRGMGTHHGNDHSTNGTLLSLGSGYWDGFRLTYHYPGRTIGLEIGRPKPSHSVSVRTEAVPDGVWHHLAATWDGHKMRVYVDGLLAASGEFDGEWTQPAQGALRIGFANSGIGSVQMDVDEVAVYARALPAEEVLTQACLAPPLGAALAGIVREAVRCGEAKEPAAAERCWAQVVGAPDVRGELATAVGLAHAECLLAAHRSPEAGRRLVAILNAADAGPQYQRMALVKLRGLVTDSPGNTLPAGAHERLLAMADLTPAERSAVLLSLGHRRLTEGDFDGARADYRKLAAQADASATVRSLVRLRIAQSYAIQRNYAVARAEYGRLATASDILPHHRWEARQQVAQLERLEKGLPARDPKATRIHLPQRPATSLSLYVAPSGSDANPGTAEKPFATLERARDEFRRLRKSGRLPVGTVEVRLRGGRYPVAKTFQLSAEDSGTAQSPIVYRAEPGQRPVFCGGLALSGFRPVTDPKVLARLPEESRAKIRQLDLRPLGIRQFKPLVLGGYASGHGFRTFPMMELYFNGRPMTLARWPNGDWTEVADVVVPDGHKIHGLAGSKTGRLIYGGDRPSRWLDDKDAMLHGYWFWSWADSYDPIASIDPAKHEIMLAEPWHRYGYRKGQPFYAVNLLSEIDLPGEWYLDRRSGRLYFYPPSDPQKAVVELSVFDQPMLRMEKVDHVALEGLVWDLGSGDAIVLRECRNCMLAGCTVSRFAGDGVILSGGRACGLLSCDVHSMGRGGIQMSGGDRKTLERAEHFVENCHIHHLSRIHPVYTPAVLLQGVGSRLSHNLFHDVPSSAIRLEGNDELVEFNEVHDVVLESDDQGGVDMFGNPTFRGNVYRYNYWHHVGDWQAAGKHPAGGRAGIRLDDAISGVLIYGNVFYRSSTGTWPFGALQIHGGKDNVADNNLFVDCRVAISFSPWGEKRWREYTRDTLQARDIDRNLYLARYAQLARLGEDHDANTISRNIVYGCQQYHCRERGTNEFVDNCLTAENPGCVGPEAGRFQFVPDPRCLKSCGFVPIPFDEIGLYSDRYRP